MRKRIRVWEWTASPWESGSSLRVVRGGPWFGYGNLARCAAHVGHDPGYSSYDRGFRCVYPV